ncbi:orotate phosphoribosyltransferase [Mesobacillus zeae]|uniref:Orotate phosphoribosyltransferase n=1 Tax=Mesobacillus zeae TaxID=1917180 RepID=A0A398BDP1_9BACI|nr:orotate phosphoribosyltransferase [Mesobacillus zeae]RID87937.1 orotate phosphoribosyltransferase [Mesobacillus zeae]
MKKEIAGSLLDIKAVALSPEAPFTWSSGLRSPIYCDNRLTLSFPDVRQRIASGMKGLIEEQFPEAELIAGTATAGIPHAAWVSDLMSLPMCYVRSKAKSHGQGNQIEGSVKKGMKAVVIEDLISTGGSAINAVNALREAGCEVLGIISIFTYELAKAEELLKEAEIKSYSLTDFSTLSSLALERGYISEGDLIKLDEWKKDPKSWGALYC